MYALLGWAYYQGAGTAKNDAEAAKWFEKAAELGDANSQYMLGYLYEDGNGVKQDYARGGEVVRARPPSRA